MAKDKGPQQVRLEQALQHVAPGTVQSSAADWTNAAELLDRVAYAFRSAQGNRDLEVSGLTGAAMREAFEKTAVQTDTHAADLRKGGMTLKRSSGVMEDAIVAHGSMPDDDEPAPGATVDKGPGSKYAHREDRAAQLADNLDVQYNESTQVMKDIHRIPDPVAPTTPTSGSGGGGGGGGGGHPTGPTRTPGPTITPTLGPTGPTDPIHPMDPANPTGPIAPVGSSSTTDPVVDTGLNDGGPGPLGHQSPVIDQGVINHDGGLNPTQIGGLALGGVGAAGLAGAIRGGLISPAGIKPAISGGPIGGTRTGASGVLGRSATGTPGSTGSPVGRGTGAGGRGTGGMGTRGGTSGRSGAGGMGTGRGGQKGREQDGNDRDLFDDGDDWLDDEGAGAVLS